MDAGDGFEPPMLRAYETAVVTTLPAVVSSGYDSRVDFSYLPQTNTLSFNMSFGKLIENCLGSCYLAFRPEGRPEIALLTVTSTDLR
jgi:hypothetical protein